MKKIIIFFVLVAFIGCNSEFNFDNQAKETFAFDEDGDPVIENVQDTDDRAFGLGPSYCYGFSTPDADLAMVDIAIGFPPEHDLSGLLPPVKSQGNQGSCVAWAAGYYLKSFQENFEDLQNGNIELENEMSPSFVFNQIKLSDDCNGSQIQTAFELLLNSGIPDWNIMPYDENSCQLNPNDLQKTLAEPNRIDAFFYLKGEILLEQTKAFLINDQPVVIAISIDRNYFGARDALGNHIYRKFKKVDGAHAMLVVGYDDSMNAFKVVNSWGKGWGNDGFVWIDYKAFSEVMNPASEFKILCEAWVTEDLIN